MFFWAAQRHWLRNQPCVHCEQALLGFAANLLRYRRFLGVKQNKKLSLCSGGLAFLATAGLNAASQDAGPSLAAFGRCWHERCSACQGNGKSFGLGEHEGSRLSKQGVPTLSLAFLTLLILIIQ